MSGIIQSLIGSLKSAAATATDAYYNLVTLLLNTSSTNGAQNNTFLDSSSNNFTITRNGNTTQGTFTPFSQTGWSNYFDGSSYLNVGTAGQSDFNFPAPSGSTNDFCIEFWFYATGTLSATTYTALVGCHDGVDSSSWSTFVRSNGIFLYGSGNTFTGGGTVNSNAWNHAAFVRSVDNVSVYLNGTRVDTQTRTGVYNNTSDLLHIGDDNSSTNPPFTGYISNVRILKGSSAAIYSGASITVPTTPLTAVTGTVLLSSQSNRFVDNSSVASSITVGAGTPSVQSFSPFAPTAAYSTTTVGGSGYFDGSGDYLSNSANTIIPSTGDFTVELWIYPTQVSTLQYLISTTSNTGNKFHLYINASAYVGVQTGASYRDSSTTTVKANAWNYIACTRTGSTYALYVNGVSQTISGTGTMAATLDVTPTQIGSRDSALNPITGYLSNFRVSTTVRTITLPTSPYSSDGSTALLLSATNAGIYDAAAKNDLETVGNAQVSTTQAKFGTTSMYFDGAGDYLVNTSTNNPLAFGTGDFTIEFWLYLNSTGTQVILDGRNSSSSDVAPLIYYLSGLKYYTAGADRITGGTLSTGQWYYIALVKASGSTKLYINGTQTGSTYTDGNTYVQQVNRPVIGAEGVSVGASPLNGYVDELRITKGYARTVTSNPTAAFPVQ